jgi:hypothetical protein
MAANNQEEDLLSGEDQKRLPELLNVLTILSFVGSAFGLLSAFWNFANARTAYESILEAQAQLSKIGKSWSGIGLLEIARKAFENRLPMLIFALAGIICCVFGAIQMRKLKKSGFYLWTLGELLPVIGYILLIGGSILSGMSMFFLLLVPSVFILLYASQRKYLNH